MTRENWEILRKSDTVYRDSLRPAIGQVELDVEQARLIFGAIFLRNGRPKELFERYHLRISGCARTIAAFEERLRLTDASPPRIVRLLP
ncbi:hypothetical protein [Bradyrhizobium macuxiense]|uniref:hypothetical protein n=1 Tax=Bradyrhizobium macuxiense TaxID=1755647 RepID=UPI0010A9558A|nr:hypothetical protein [Bradyrhizobium macuxiense]